MGTTRGVAPVPHARSQNRGANPAGSTMVASPRNDRVAPVPHARSQNMVVKPAGPQRLPQPDTIVRRQFRVHFRRMTGTGTLRRRTGTPFDGTPREHWRVTAPRRRLSRELAGRSLYAIYLIECCE